MNIRLFVLSSDSKLELRINATKASPKATMTLVRDGQRPSNSSNAVYSPVSYSGISNNQPVSDGSGAAFATRGLAARSKSAGSAFSSYFFSD